MKPIYLFFIITLFPLLYQKEFLSISEKDKLFSFANQLDLETIRNDIITSHNKYRKDHQANELIRSSDLESIAQEYSEILVDLSSMIASNNEYKGDSLGENIYQTYGTGVSGTEASDSWYAENIYYNYNNPGAVKEAAHFTQLVWKNSRQIGCGAACKSICVVVCNYYPSGNLAGQYSSNVYAIGGSQSDSKEKDSSNTENNENSENSDSSGSNQSNNNKKKGMSGAGKFFLVMFILLLIAVAAFSVYHFKYKRRSLKAIKLYFDCC